MKKELKRGLSIVGFLYCAIILGSHYIITKQLSGSIDVAMLTAYRFLVAAIPLYFYLLYLRKNPFKNIKPGIILGFFLWLIFILVSVGLKYATATNAGFISGMFFIFVPFISYFVFKARFRWVYLPVFLISSLGLYFLTGGLSQIELGGILILLSAIFTAVHIVLVGHYSRKGLDPVVLCFQQFAVVFLLSIMYALVAQKFILTIPIAQTPPLLFLGLFSTLSVFFIQMLSLKYSSTIAAAIILSLQPGFAAFFAYWLGGERFTGFQFFWGILLFISAIIFAFFNATKSKKKYDSI